MRQPNTTSMQLSSVLPYLPGLLLIGGFTYLTYQNSPKHAMWLLGIVVGSILIGYLTPREKTILIGAAIGIVGVFVVMVQSRNVRERSLSDWFAEKEFRWTEFSAVKSLFNTATAGRISYSTYTGNLIINQQKISCLMATRYSTTTVNNSVSIILDFSYYFSDPESIDLFEQKFITAKENTPHTNLWKSQLRFFDLKDCEIFRPSIGGLVVSWRTPATLDGYNDRYNWIINALQS
ncbi:hypothetical protein GCM10027592_25620 [Spirosoma flavus]